MSEYFNLSHFEPDLLDTAKIKHFVSLWNETEIYFILATSPGQQTLQHSQKLEFYQIFKIEYAPSHYLDLTTRTSERRVLTKLRISRREGREG